MKTFEYQVLRYMPDRVNGEFINLGVVVFNRHERILNIEIAEKTGRLSDIFPGINSRYIIKVAKAIKSDLIKISNQLSKELMFEPNIGLDKITSKVIPIDDSALFFTHTEQTLDLDINSASSYLYDRLINLHQNEEEKEIKHDKEVWTKVYKHYFDTFGISTHLSQHTIKTKFNDVHFDHAWKNGHWNFFEPVSFKLDKKESIKNKVHRWAGQIDELLTSDEKTHLYLLSILPEDPQTINYIKDFLKGKSNEKITVEVISKEEAETVVSALQYEIGTH